MLENLYTEWYNTGIKENAIDRGGFVPENQIIY